MRNRYNPQGSNGGDKLPRTNNSAVTQNTTTENYRKALDHARDYADRHPRQVPLITINSWNEWTETSYLQPDNVYGYGYLEAVKSVFVDSLQTKKAAGEKVMNQAGQGREKERKKRK